MGRPRTMFRNQYDTDCITWSPQGRIHQIEYAEEAVKQGSCCVGLVSKTHAVLATLKRSNSELGSYQQKVFKIDNHIGIGIAGLTPDGRVLSHFLSLDWSTKSQTKPKSAHSDQGSAHMALVF